MQPGETSHMRQIASAAHLNMLMWASGDLARAGQCKHAAARLSITGVHLLQKADEHVFVRLPAADASPRRANSTLAGAPGVFVSNHTHPARIDG